MSPNTELLFAMVPGYLTVCSVNSQLPIETITTQTLHGIGACKHSYILHEVFRLPSIWPFGFGVALVDFVPSAATWNTLVATSNFSEENLGRESPARQANRYANFHSGCLLF